MAELNEVIIPLASAAGKTRIDNVYRGGNDYVYFGGAVEKVVIDVTTGSGFVNGGSLWIGISGTTERLLEVSSLSGTTTRTYYPRIIINNVSGTVATPVSGNNVYTNVVLPKNAIVFAGGSLLATSGATIGAGQVAANVSIFWHKY